MLKQEFAVIVLDVSMPEMDGFEVARLMRSQRKLERTPIIFGTGAHVSEFDQLKRYEVGAIDYMLWLAFSSIRTVTHRAVRTQSDSLWLRPPFPSNYGSVRLWLTPGPPAPLSTWST